MVSKEAILFAASYLPQTHPLQCRLRSVATNKMHATIAVNIQQFWEGQDQNPGFNVCLFVFYLCNPHSISLSAFHFQISPHASRSSIPPVLLLLGTVPAGRQGGQLR